MLDAFIHAVNDRPITADNFWSSPLGWTYVVADALIVGAFFALAVALWLIVERRDDLRYSWVIAVIGVTLFAAGTTYLLDIWALWQAQPWLDAWLTLFTALVALVSAVGLWRALPHLLATPSSHEARAEYEALLAKYRQVSHSEARFRSVAEIAPEGIWLLDRDGITLYANPMLHTMLRCDGPLEGRSLFDFVYPEDQAMARQRLMQRLAGDRERREFSWRRGDGTPLDSTVVTTVMLAPNGSIAGVMGFVTDISDRVAMSEELQRLNLELGQRVEARTRELEDSNRELAREIVVREYVQAELSASNERLNHYLAALQRHTDDITRLNELADQLNACESRRELIQVLQSSCQDLFATTGGALFEAGAERMNLLEFGWGDCAGLEGSFAPDQCLGLREGKPFPGSAQQQGGVVCMHRPSLQPALCVPLHARGAQVGLLLLQRAEPFWSGEAVSDRQLEQLLRALAEHTALALDNLSLRERLREQSLSDPLTGLFNRRYLFEQMEREMAGYERSRRSFALMLIDIDHFKKFNDRYGHAIGDAVLVEVANLLREYTRRSDLACRLGGEEFVVLMSGAEQAQAIDRAEAIREAVKQIRLPGVNEVISISAGVAVYPEHGDEQQNLLRAADQALYASKRGGRDRTSMAV